MTYILWNSSHNNYFQSYLKDTTGAADGNPDPQFIRKLTTAVAESTIKGNKCKWNDLAFKYKIMSKSIKDIDEFHSK